MTDLLAVSALLISAAALLIAWRAASAAERAAGSVPKSSLPDAVPAGRSASATSATDPSVLVRLDALESRQASHDLLASVRQEAVAASGAEPGAGTGAGAGAGSAEAEQSESTRRPHPMFP